MIKEPTVKYKRKASMVGWITGIKSTLVFGMDQQSAIDDPNIRKPGKQNKHHGRQPGSYKRKRVIVRNARRRNRT